jgi:hypothetical protein
MTVKWKVAVAGGTVLGVGLGGFAAADEIERPEPDGRTVQQDASPASPFSSLLRIKVRAGFWYPEGGSPVSADSPGTVNSPGTNSPASVDSPASPASPPAPQRGSGSGSGGGSGS